MKRITMNTFDRLKTLADNKFSYYLEYRTACDLWNRSVYYNKLQNQFIKDNEPNEVVQSFQLFSEDSKQVEYFSVRAKEQFTRDQWFVLLLGSDLCTYSREQLKAVVS